MKKTLLLVLISLCGCDGFSQDTTNHGFIGISTTAVLYKGEKSHPRQYLCADIKFPHSKAFFAIRQGFDVPSRYSTTTALYGGVYFGTDKFHAIPKTGLLWSFNGGYNGWSPMEIEVGGTYCIAHKIRGSYLIVGQYTINTDYDLTHIIVHAQGSDFLREYGELTVQITKFMSIGYGAQFFNETSKKDVVLNGVRSSVPLQSNNPRGFLMQFQIKNVYFKPQLLWGSEERMSITLGYKQIK